MMLDVQSTILNVFNEATLLKSIIITMTYPFTVPFFLMKNDDVIFYNDDDDDDEDECDVGHLTQLH